MPFSIICALVEAGVTGSTPAEAGVTGSTLVETRVTGSNEPKYTSSTTVGPLCNGNNCLI